jgi:two-component system response regulator
MQSKSTGSYANLQANRSPNPVAPVRLLVVEDNQDDQELLLRQLRKASFHENVLFIGDGEKAVELLVKDEAKSIFAIFLDLNLQGASGLDVVRFIRSKPEIAKIPVIVMTGSTNPEDTLECRRLKVASFVSKPVTFQSFSMAVANVFHLPAVPVDLSSA